MNIAAKLFAKDKSTWEEASEVAIVELSFRLQNGSRGGLLLFDDQSGALFFSMQRVVLLLDWCDLSANVFAVTELLQSLPEPRN